MNQEVEDGQGMNVKIIGQNRGGMRVSGCTGGAGVNGQLKRIVKEKRKIKMADKCVRGRKIR